MKITMTRDSVCMGDDCMAPHFEYLFVDENTVTTEDDIKASLIKYLPPVTSGMFWTLEADFKAVASICLTGEHTVSFWEIVPEWREMLLGCKYCHCSRQPVPDSLKEA